MNLTRLIKKFERVITIKDTSTEGRYENGKWIEPQPIERQFYGAMLPLTTEELQIYEAGIYTTQDIKLFVVNDLKDINNSPLEISIGEIITVDNTDFEIKEEIDVSEIAGFKKFIAKKVL